MLSRPINVTVGMASGYLAEDQGYLAKDSSGKWHGELAKEKGLVGKIEPEVIKAIENGLERFRTYSVTFSVNSALVNKVGDKIVIEGCLRNVATDTINEISNSLRVKFKRGNSDKTKYNYFISTDKNTGNLKLRIRSHNVAPANWETVKKGLNNASVRDSFKLKMMEALKADGIESKKNDFTYRSYENLGRVGSGYAISAPKSCSIAMHLDEGFKKDFLDSHRNAVNKVLHYIENNYIKTKNGEYTGNMLAASFDHYSSRHNDPLTHTHILVYNQTKDSNGKLKAIENVDLHRNFIFLGKLYRSEILKDLMVNKGWDMEVWDKENFFIDLKGFSSEQKNKFSKGSNFIKEYLESKGYSNDTFELKNKIANSIKPEKAEVPIEFLEEKWRNELKEYGISKSILTKSNYNSHEFNKEEFFAKVTEYIENTSGTFTPEDFAQISFDHISNHPIVLDDANNYIEKNLRENHFSKIQVFGKEYLISEIALKREEYIFERIKSGVNAVKGIPYKNYIDKLNSLKLPDDHSMAIKYLLGNKHQIKLLNGVAGSAKTSAVLKHVSAIYVEQGYKIKGLCFPGRGALKLQEGAEIESSTIHSHLNQLDNLAGDPVKVPPEEIKNDWNFTNLCESEDKELWIVDEANLVNNKLMYYLLLAAEKRNVEVILCGHDAQLQPIGYGNPFTRMIREGVIGYMNLLKSYRHLNSPDFIKESIHQAAHGNIAKSLELLEEVTKEIEMNNERLEIIASEYSSLNESDRDASLIITGQNNDRCRLNELVREHLKESGYLIDNKDFEVRNKKGKSTTIELAEGDRIIFLRSRMLGDRKLLNGQDAKILKINDGTFTVDSYGEIFDISLKDYNYLTHFYASTTWKAEGSDFKNIYLNIDTNQTQINSREDYYVKISRCRSYLKIWTNDRINLYDAVSRSLVEYRPMKENRFFNKLNRFQKGIQKYLMNGYSNLMNHKICEDIANASRDAAANIAHVSIQKHNKYVHKADVFQNRSDKHLEKSQKFFCKAEAQLINCYKKSYDKDFLNNIVDTFRKEFIPAENNDMVMSRVSKGLRATPDPQRDQLLEIQESLLNEIKVFEDINKTKSKDVVLEAQL